MSDTRRRKRREMKFLSNESTWLQKALFALQKAETAREKRADLQGLDEIPFVLPHGDGELRVDDFIEAMEDRIQELLTEVRERRKALR